MPVVTAPLLYMAHSPTPFPTKRPPTHPQTRIPKRRRTIPTLSPTSSKSQNPIPSSLPDEVLISVFRFVTQASQLAALRPVCRQWCRIIDQTPCVWRSVSFKHASFIRRVISTESNTLALGPRAGAHVVALAARAGNEWACFLQRVIFEGVPLRAVTVPQPTASMLVSGERTWYKRPFAPGGGEKRGEVGWVVIHAARRVAEGGGKLPRGAVVGLVRIERAHWVEGGWMWKVDRAVRLKKAIRCAGFVGLWRVSSVLTDVLVDAMHNQ